MKYCMIIALLAMTTVVEAGIITQLHVTSTPTSNPWELTISNPFGLGDETFGFAQGAYLASLTRNDLNIDMTSMQLILPSGHGDLTWHSILPVWTGGPQNHVWDRSGFVPGKSYTMVAGIGDELNVVGDNFVTLNDLYGPMGMGNFAFNPDGVRFDLGLDGDLLSVTSNITPAMYLGASPPRTLYISGTAASVPEGKTFGMLATGSVFILGFQLLRRKKKKNVEPPVETLAT